MLLAIPRRSDEAEDGGSMATPAHAGVAAHGHAVRHLASFHHVISLNSAANASCYRREAATYTTPLLRRVTAAEVQFLLEERERGNLFTPACRQVQRPTHLHSV